VEGESGSRRTLASASSGQQRRGLRRRWVVACPKDVVMYDDAIKISGHEGVIRVAELSELVGQACEERENAVALLS
jgi:hypothetical protein